MADGLDLSIASQEKKDRVIAYILDEADVDMVKNEMGLAGLPGLDIDPIEGQKGKYRLSGPALSVFGVYWKNKSLPDLPSVMDEDDKRGGQSKKQGPGRYVLLDVDAELFKDQRYGSRFDIQLKSTGKGYYLIEGPDVEAFAVEWLERMQVPLPTEDKIEVVRDWARSSIPAPGPLPPPIEPGGVSEHPDEETHFESVFVDEVSPQLPGDPTDVTERTGLASESAPLAPAPLPEPTVQIEPQIDWSAQLPNSPSESPSEEEKKPDPRKIDWETVLDGEEGKT